MVTTFVVLVVSVTIFLLVVGWQGWEVQVVIVTTLVLFSVDVTGVTVVGVDDELVLVVLHEVVLVRVSVDVVVVGGLSDEELDDAPWLHEAGVCPLGV